jgi:hypothetical protein
MKIVLKKIGFAALGTAFAFLMLFGAAGTASAFVNVGAFIQAGAGFVGNGYGYPVGNFNNFNNGCCGTGFGMQNVYGTQWNNGAYFGNRTNIGYNYGTGFVNSFVPVDPFSPIYPRQQNFQGSCVTSCNVGSYGNVYRSPYGVFNPMGTILY